jgi:hypothetical protein
MVLHPNIQLGKNHYGYGLFATAPIAEGEMIWHESDAEIAQCLIIEKSTLADLPQAIVDRVLHFGWEISLTELSLSPWLEAYVFGRTESLPLNPVQFENQFEKLSFAVSTNSRSEHGQGLDQDANHSDFMNHSCDPNVWYQDDNTQVARRPIAAGEEICQDYAMDRSGPMEFKCLCGTPACRGVIRKNDFALPEIRKRYGDHVRSLVAQAWEEPSLLEALKHSYSV